MADFQLYWGEFGADLVKQAQDLLLDDSLESAVIVSLFTDARADESDDLPAGVTDRRGWWGDDLPTQPGDIIGSKLWLLSREKQTPEVLIRAEEYATAALEWLVRDLVASSVSVAASYVAMGFMALDINISRPDGSAVSYRYNLAWQAQENRRIS